MPEKIILGDQSIWNGGYSRYEYMVSRGYDVRYLAQDADVPWVANSNNISLKEGWPHHYSLALRMPFALEVPSADMNDVRNSLKIPKGLCYLSGPSTNSTIFSEDENGKVVDLLVKMLGRGVQWAKGIGEWIGNTESDYRASYVESAVNNIDSIAQAYLCISQLHNLPKPESLINFFQENPVRLMKELGTSNYWGINSSGHRGQVSDKNLVVVPRGNALLLEFSALGYTTGFTKVPYLSDVIDLRNERVPGLSIKTAQISFNIDLSPNPIEKMTNEYATRKANRQQFYSLDGKAITTIGEYWSQRDTSISSFILQTTSEVSCEFYDY